MFSHTQVCRHTLMKATTLCCPTNLSIASVNSSVTADTFSALGATATNHTQPQPPAASFPPERYTPCANVEKNKGRSDMGQKPGKRCCDVSFIAQRRKKTQKQTRKQMLEDSASSRITSSRNRLRLDAFTRHVLSTHCVP